MRAILILLFMVHALAAFGQSSTPADTLKIGVPTTSTDKGFIFDTADGGSNKSLKIEKSTKLLKFDGNAIQIGDGALTSAKEIKFNGTSGKVLKYDHTNTEFSINDDLAIDAGQKLKTNSIDTKSGTTTSVEQDLRSKGKLFLGASGSVQLRENAGKLEFSNDGSIYKKVGSGGGGAGALTVLENGGFEDGITSGWSATGSTATAVTGSANALVGETSVSFDPAAQNDYLRTSYITIPKGLRGSACEARFLYTGGDALNLSAKVETESGVILGTFNNGSAANVLPYHNSTAGYESIYFKCPTQADITTLSTNGNIRLVIYQGTVTNAAAIVIDDVHLGGLIGLTETTIPDVFGFVVNGTGGAVVTRTDGLYPVTCTRLSAGSYDCPFGVTFQTAPSCSVTPIGPPQVELFSSTTSLAFTLRSAGTNTPIDSGSIEVICKKMGADAKQSVQVFKSIPKIADNFNEFTAYVNFNGTQIVQSSPFISGCSSSVAGKWVCTFVASQFSAGPLCTASSESGDTANDHTAKLIALNGTSASINTTVNGVLTNTGFYISCRRRDTDIKMPTVQPMVIGQVTNSVAESSLNNVRVEACTISNNGTATMSTVSGLCEGWVQSVSRTPSIGRVLITVKAGIFSMPPVCHNTSGFGSSAFGQEINVISATSIDTVAIGSGGALDANIYLTCVGRR